MRLVPFVMIYGRKVGNRLELGHVSITVNPDQVRMILPTQVPSESGITGPNGEPQMQEAAGLELGLPTGPITVTCTPEVAERKLLLESIIPGQAIQDPQKEVVVDDVAPPCAGECDQCESGCEAEPQTESKIIHFPK